MNEFDILLAIAKDDERARRQVLTYATVSTVFSIISIVLSLYAIFH